MSQTSTSGGSRSMRVERLGAPSGRRDLGAACSPAIAREQLARVRLVVDDEHADAG